MTTPRTALTGLAIIAALMLGACQDDEVPPIEVSGWVQLSAGRFTEGEGEHDCTPDAEMPAEGTPVVVTDRAGTTLAQTTLDAGWTQRLRQHPDDTVVTVRCLLHFFLSVPGGLDEYGLTVTGEETRWMSAARIAQPGLVL